MQKVRREGQDYEEHNYFNYRLLSSSYEAKLSSY
jgi:hypothetical protein